MTYAKGYLLIPLPGFTAKVSATLNIKALANYVRELHDYYDLA